MTAEKEVGCDPKIWKWGIKTDRREGVFQATLEKSNDCNKQEAFIPSSSLGVHHSRSRERRSKWGAFFSFRSVIGVSSTNEISCYIEGTRWSRCRKNLVKQSWFCGFRTDGWVGVKYRQAQVPESEVVPKEAKPQETVAQWILLGFMAFKSKN